MSLLPSDKVLHQLSDIIHADTQQHKWQIDLTVSEIHTLSGAGSLDFGGSEFREAEYEQLIPEKKNPDDTYGWWELTKGTHRVVFNESIAESESSWGIIALHPHARKAGLIGNTQIIVPEENPDQLSMNIIVPEEGCHIKENARLASLYMVDQ